MTEKEIADLTKIDGLPRCLQCGKVMRLNVPRLGPDGGYVHDETSSLLCDPVKAAPASEAWLHENPEALAWIGRAHAVLPNAKPLAPSERASINEFFRAQIHDLGDFTQGVVTGLVPKTTEERLAEAEEEIKQLREQIVYCFYGDEVPLYIQGAGPDGLCDVVTAVDLNHLAKLLVSRGEEIVELRLQLAKWEH